MSELFDSLNFPAGTGLTSSQSSQPTTSRVFWHATPSPALLGNRTGTPSRLREQESPTVPPLCTQAFLGELRKVSSNTGTWRSCSAAAPLDRYAGLNSPASPKARGKRRAEPRDLSMDDNSTYDSDIVAQGRQMGNRLFLGDESSPESRRRRTMDAGNTGRLRKSPPPSSADEVETPQSSNHIGRADESIGSTVSKGGAASGDSSETRAQGKRGDASSSSTTSRRLLRRSRGGSKRHQPGWVGGLGITSSDSPASVLALPLLEAALDEAMDAQQGPPTARKLFEDLNAVLDESYHAIRQHPDGTNGTTLRRANETASQPSGNPPVNVNSAAAAARPTIAGVEMKSSDAAAHRNPSRSSLQRSSSVPSHRLVDAHTRTQDGPAEGQQAGNPSPYRSRRPLEAIKSHNDVFACDVSEAAHQQRRKEVEDFALLRAVSKPGEAPPVRAQISTSDVSRPLATRSNLPPRQPSHPPKSPTKEAHVARDSSSASPPKRNTSNDASRKKLGLRPPQHSETLGAQRSVPGLVGATEHSTSCEVVDLTMDEDDGEDDHASTRSTSPQKSRTPSPTKLQPGAGVSSVVPLARRSRSVAGGPTKAALGMGKISSACLSQARQPGLPRSSQAVLGTQRQKRATTAGAAPAALGTRAQQLQSQRTRSSPSAPFRPPAKTRLQNAAAGVSVGAAAPRAEAASRTTSSGPPPPPRKAHVGSDDSFGLSDTDDAAFASLASELGF